MPTYISFKFFFLYQLLLLLLLLKTQKTAKSPETRVQMYTPNIYLFNNI